MCQLCRLHGLCVAYSTPIISKRFLVELSMKSVPVIERYGTPLTKGRRSDAAIVAVVRRVMLMMWYGKRLECCSRTAATVGSVSRTHTRICGSTALSILCICLDWIKIDVSSVLCSKTRVESLYESLYFSHVTHRATEALYGVSSNSINAVEADS